MKFMSGMNYPDQQHKRLLTADEKKAKLEIGKLINAFSSRVALAGIGKGKVPDIIEVIEKVYSKAQLAKVDKPEDVRLQPTQYTEYCDEENRDSFKHRDKPEVCPDCEGTRFYPTKWGIPDDISILPSDPCPTCQGTGESRPNQSERMGEMAKLGELHRKEALNKPVSSVREKILAVLDTHIDWVQGTKTASDCKMNPLPFYLTEPFQEKLADRLIALFEKQFNPDYLDFKKGVKATEVIWKVKVKEAGEQERERIIGLLEKYNVGLNDNEWQALKGDK